MKFKPLLTKLFTQLKLALYVFTVSLGASYCAFADDNFWRFNTSQTQFKAQDSSGNLSANLVTGENRDNRGYSVPQANVTLTRNLTDRSAVTLQYGNSLEQRNFVLGYTHKDLSVSLLQGSGEDYAALDGDYSGVDPYLFHGGFKQQFDVSGYAIDYGVSGLGHLQFGQAKVSADNLEDRRARYFEWSNNRYFARFSEFSRGNDAIGSGLDLGFAMSANKRIAFQSMSLEQDKRLQRLRFQLDGQHSRQYWVDFSAHQNPLYEANNDYRVMFTFRTLLGAKSWVNHQNDTGGSVEDDAVDGETGAAPNKKKGKGWKRAVFIGGGVAAAAALSSSGSKPADRLSRFRTQNDAAKDVLNEVNPQSIRINREFGGWVFVSPDGSYGTSAAVQGEAASVRLPDPELSVPVGSIITASYHTHAAFDPRFDNENFSPQDLENDRANNIDGYLATPLGQFKLHDIQTDTIVTLGTVATE
jgi:hypothetical protein